MKKYPFLFVLGMMISSCQDVIKVTIPGGTPALAVSGWLTNRNTPDTIALTMTGHYLDSTAPVKVTGATVQLTGSNGASETLNEWVAGSGKYLIVNTRAQLGVTFTLTINENGQTFSARNTIHRNSPTLDSIHFKFHKKGFQYDSTGYYVLIFGQEFPGLGDCVRFRVWKNNRLLNRVSDLTAYQDKLVDGTYFNNGLGINQSEAFKLGDSITVEAWSLNQDEYNFFDQLRTQIENRGLFQTTPANVITNVINSNPTSSAQATGYFGGSLIQSISRIVK